MSRTGHPVPGSDEARHNEVSEHLDREKGRGDDPPPTIQPEGDPVTPAGKPYRYDDLGRGPGTKGGIRRNRQEKDRMAKDQDKDVSADSPRMQRQNGVDGGGRQIGGGPEAVDNRAPGGSSGSGGYGKMQNQQNMQGQEGKNLSGLRSDQNLSRGERFDEQQGGGRGPESVSAPEEEGDAR